MGWSVTYLDVVPGSFGGSAVVVDCTTGLKYVLSSQDAIRLASRLLAVAAQPGRVVANGAVVTTPPAPQPIPFREGPVDPALAGTMATVEELQRLHQQGPPPPATQPPPSTVGTTTGFGKQ